MAPPSAPARELDRWCLRGPRPDPGLAGIDDAIAKASRARDPPPPAQSAGATGGLVEKIAALLAPLEKLFAQRAGRLRLLDTHVAAAEALARDEPRTIACCGPRDDGEAAFELVAALRLAARKSRSRRRPNLPWPPLFRSLAMKVPVRATFGRHPRLAILGPLEARLQRFDLTVLGGLNEGTWPQAAGSDPWFSRPMRATLGLEQPERSIGLSAHDFAMLAAGPQVLLTRALKADGTPTIASRWLQRLTQLTGGLELEDALAPKLRLCPALAAQLMDVPQGPRLPRPAPTPPVETRPRRLSVTEIETWLRDPYAIYAKHVLGLRPLEALDEPIGPLERGTALHKALELFIGKYKDGLPDDAERQLTAIADQVFSDAGIPKAALALWRPRFAGAARGFVEFERSRRDTIADSHLEIKGSLRIGDFTLSGVADRIDVLKDGKAAILDYKTGAVPSTKQVTQLLSPQLPLEGGHAGARRLSRHRQAHRRRPDLSFSLASEEQARKPRDIPDAAALAGERGGATGAAHRLV